MNTRRGIIAALAALAAWPSKKVDAQEFKVDDALIAGESTTTFAQLEITGKVDWFLVVKADGREIRLTTKEVMDALEGK